MPPDTVAECEPVRTTGRKQLAILLLSWLIAISTPIAQPLTRNTTVRDILTALLIDLTSRKTISTTGVDINGHEVVVSPDGRFGYVPIYGNSGVGKPGT